MVLSQELDSVQSIAMECGIKESNNFNRIYSMQTDYQKINDFFKSTNNITLRDLEYIPYYRFLVSRALNNCFKGKLKNALLNILNDYNTGALLISIEEFSKNKEDFIKFATAVSHLLGTLNIDLLSGKYYATFTVENDPHAPINLLRPYDNFRMHTDGAFMQEPTDWILFMKMHEENVIGGKTKLLHMGDWCEYEYFYQHELGLNSFKFAGPPSSDKRSENWGNHRKTDTLMSPILKIENGKKLIRFVDQFIHPENLAEADYVNQIQESLENSKNIIETDLPVGSLLIINNTFWTHGRSQFQSHLNLKRELMRQRGAFINE